MATILVESNAMPNLLSERVEELAAELVLGGMDGLQWAAPLEGVCREAETAGRADVARIAAESLDALPAMADAGGIEALFSSRASRACSRLWQGMERGSPGASGHAGPSAPDTAPAPSTLGEDPEMIGDFILESRDHLTQVEIQMMTLEKEPGDSEAINTVFRGFHTIKGLAGFLDLDDIREVAHETETLLDLARNQKLRITPAVVDLVLAAADFLKIWSKRLETGLAGSDPDRRRKSWPYWSAFATERLREPDAAVSAPEIAAKIRPAQPTEAEPKNVEAATATGAESNGEAPTATGERRVRKRDSVKVDTAKLDFLVDMAGEMVIAQSMVRHHPELAALRSPAAAAQSGAVGAHHRRLAEDRHVHAHGAGGRTVPEDEPSGAGPRRKTGKQAEMEAIGGDTELDRNIVEELADPLMHMVRNAADHGLETPEERRAAGKSRRREFGSAPATRPGISSLRSPTTGAA